MNIYNINDLVEYNGMPGIVVGINDTTLGITYDFFDFDTKEIEVVFEKNLKKFEES